MGIHKSLVEYKTGKRHRPSGRKSAESHAIVHIKRVGRVKAVLDWVALGQCGMTMGHKGEDLAEENPNTVPCMSDVGQMHRVSEQNQSPLLDKMSAEAGKPALDELTNENNSVVQKESWWSFWGPAKAQRRKRVTSEGIQH